MYIGTLDCEFPDYEKYLNDNLETIRKAVNIARQFIPGDDYDDQDRYIEVLAALAACLSFVQTEQIPVPVEDLNDPRLSEWCHWISIQIVLDSLVHKGILEQEGDLYKLKDK